MTVALAGAPVLVIGPQSAAQAVRPRCQGQPVDRVDDVLTAMERLTATGASAVFVWIAALPNRAGSALAAIRQLLPAEVRMILIARPDEEPLARNLLPNGADDYLIWPLQTQDVATALGRPGKDLPIAAASAPADVASIPLVDLAEVLRLAETDPGNCLDRLAALLCDRMRARACTIEMPDAVSVCGESTADPVLAVQIDLGEGHTGRIALGPRRGGAYSPADTALLQGFAATAGVVIRLATTAAAWRREALTDELTGLVNRRGLLRQLPEILDISRRRRTTVTLLLFDIDDFKHYNDAYSHDTGDEILREAGRLFTMSTRQHDVVARYGGDEFVVVFWEADEPRKVGSKPPRDVLALLNRFRQSLTSHQFRSLGPEAQGKLTISGGLVTFPWDAATPEQLIAMADEALLLAKRQGKNRIWLVGEGAQ